jgi:hypothetical protein
MFKLAYSLGCLEALIKLGAPVNLTPEQLKRLRAGEMFRDIFTPQQLQGIGEAGGGWSLGMEEGRGGGAKPVRQPVKPLSVPAQEHMRQLSEFGTPAPQLPPTLKQTQQRWRTFSQSELPELIGASEDYLTSGGKLNPEGVRRSLAQQQKLDAWIAQKGRQIINPEAIVGRTSPASAPVAAATSAGTIAEPLASAAQKARAGQAATQVARAAPEATSKGMQFAKTLLRRFAHV